MMLEKIILLLMLVSRGYSQETLTETLSPICLEYGKSTRRTRPFPSEVDKCLLNIEPSPSIDTLKKMLVGLPLHGSLVGLKHAPYNPQWRQFGNDWPPFGYTMIGIERLENFRAAINEVNRNQIQGAIIELGVWRGGAMILAAALQQESKVVREMYLFDAFGELPNGGYGVYKDFLAVDIEKVKAAFKHFGVYDENHVHFVKGLFEDTTAQWKYRNESIAVLRVDGNFYDSYQDVMYAMYENVPVGGIVIFDDVFSHPGVTRFWNDFKTDQGLPEELVRIDDHSGWFRKKTEIKIDFAKKHPPTGYKGKFKF